MTPIHSYTLMTVYTLMTALHTDDTCSLTDIDYTPDQTRLCSCHTDHIPIRLFPVTHTDHSPTSFLSHRPHP